MKTISIREVSEELFYQNLVGVKYKINQNGVSLSMFTPPLISDSDKNSPNISMSHSRFPLNLFRLSLVQPFFLPLKSSLNGLYDKCAYYLPELLDNNENISIIWLFQRKNNWKMAATTMYDSYLKGNDNPSEINIIRKVEDKVMEYKNKIVSPLSQREFSQDVEDKILDEGFCFQCMVEINSNKNNQLADLIEDIFKQYDYHNGLRLDEIDYIYPYTLYPTNQLLSKKEIASLLCQSELEIETEDNPVQEEIKGKQQSEKVSNDRIGLLPKIKKEEVKVDDSILPKLADALKRTGVIKQARLYNESIEQGSRLVVIHADIPKDKNFSDVEKKKIDIQAALGVQSLGIEQGNEAGTIKYSIPHNSHQIVSLREIIERKDFQKYNKDSQLAFIAGLDEIGNPIYLSLQELVHLGIYGTTGSGKSVFLNTLLTTLLITHAPETLQLLLIDPKQVELQQYQNFPHTQNVITDMEKAQESLEGLIGQMEYRYKLFKDSNVKDINGYNQKHSEKLYFTVVVIEEYADLYDSIGKKVENPIKRLGQKARACGIHLIIVTQRPSADNLSSSIKSNIPNAISFNLNNNNNYRTVFGKGVPYTLLGKGDGVARIINSEKEFQRFQSCMIANNPIEEELFYDELRKTYSDNAQVDTINENVEDDSLLGQLKREIAMTGETKVSVLREKLSVKSSTLSALLSRLVDENWLIKHRSKAKGYELIADDKILSEWRDK